MRDAIVRGGTLVHPEGRAKADRRIEAGRIIEIAPDLSGSGEEVDARTVVSGAEHLSELGRLTLCKGAQPITIDRANV